MGLSLQATECCTPGCSRRWAMRLIECVPNFSVGRDLQTVHRIRTAIAESPGARVLDHSSDASHNRSVITFMAPPDCVGEDRKSTRLNSSHVKISYAVFCLKKK